MKRFSIILALTFLMIDTSSYGQFWKRMESIKPSGEIVESTKTLKTFNKIDISSAFDVELINASKDKISIFTDKAFLPYIVAEIKGNTLHIYAEKNFNRKDNDIPLKIVLYAQHIEAIDISGAVDLHSDDVWSSEDLYLQCSGASEVDIQADCNGFKAKLSGASEIDLKLRCNNSNISVSGASELELEGETEQAFFSISGASEVDAITYKAAVNKAKVSGASSAHIYASERIDINASGVSEVVYGGKARNTVIESSSLSKIRKR